MLYLCDLRYPWLTCLSRIRLLIFEIHNLVAFKGDFVMKTRNLSMLLASLFVIAGAVFAAAARAEGEVPAPPAIGATIEDFTLPDVDNKERSLKSLAGKNGTVLLFIAVQCPVSNAYNERMEKLAQD